MSIAIIIHDQIKGEILDKEGGVMFKRLLIQRVQNGVACAIGCRAGSLCSAFAVMRGHTPERALINLAVFCA